MDPSSAALKHSSKLTRLAVVLGFVVADEHTADFSGSASFSLSSSLMVKRTLEGPYMFWSLKMSITSMSSSSWAVEFRLGGVEVGSTRELLRQRKQRSSLEEEDNEEAKLVDESENVWELVGAVVVAAWGGV
ncbi:unnamed protein product [Coffea canephora]|uniref:Uncharacterized protein n=1 Tax=Coffea canephora TaxID=49390 RepID=A0A068UQN8_COFCA|nr:unnamed protein product [Coffea canephora]